MENQCPKIKDVTDDVLDLSYEERLEIFQKEAVSLYEFCSKKGFTNKEVNTCVSKLYGPPKSVKRKALEDSYRSLFLLAILVAISGALYASPETNNFISAHFKLFTIEYVLPYWNYSELWNEDCFIYNKWLPSQNEAEMNEEACQYCSNIAKLNNNTFDRIRNLSKKDMSKHYISFTQPVIVEDGMKNWNSPSLNMEILSKLYQTHPLLSTSMGSCAYSTSIDDFSTFYDFITAYTDQTLPEKWHTRWENCDMKSAKIIRKYYKRLYCIPDSAESTQFNSIIAAKGATTERHKYEVETSQGRWLTVVSGSLTGYLLPLTECVDKYGCYATEFVLEAGQAVFYYPDHWEMEYMITSNGDEITLAVSTSFVWDIQ